MRVAVVTALYKADPAWLAQCHDSVRSQKHACTHLLVRDGDEGGEPPAGFDGQLIRLPQNTGDWGDTPRAIGALAAYGQGFDAVSWLDQDNWFYPEHIANLVAVHQKSGAHVCASSRDVYHLDGTLMGKCRVSDGDQFVDANCFLITKQARAIAAAWAQVPPPWHICSDIWFCGLLRRRRVRRAFSNKATMGYRATRTHLYQHYGVTPPPGVKSSAEIVESLRAAGALPPPHFQPPAAARARG